jgi:hypothetical protein
MNPEIAKKQNNIQLTPISEYSNAVHNKTVFVNPKNISCWQEWSYLHTISEIVLHLLEYEPSIHWNLGQQKTRQELWSG